MTPGSVKPLAAAASAAHPWVKLAALVGAAILTLLSMHVCGDRCQAPSRSKVPARAGRSMPSTSGSATSRSKACRSSSPHLVPPSGRQDFANGITDFGVSDIGYQGHRTPSPGVGRLVTRTPVRLPPESCRALHDFSLQHRGSRP